MTARAANAAKPKDSHVVCREFAAVIDQYNRRQLSLREAVAEIEKRTGVKVSNATISRYGCRKRAPVIPKDKAAAVNEHRGARLRTETGLQTPHVAHDETVPVIPKHKAAAVKEHRGGRLRRETGLQTPHVAHDEVAPMKVKEEQSEEDRTLKKLALYSRCASCICEGWKSPGGRTADESAYEGNEDWMRDTPLNAVCRQRNHSLGKHVGVRKIKERDMRILMTLIVDMESMYRRLKRDDNSEVRQVVEMLLNVYKKAVGAGKCKKFFESPFNTPPFEPLSITKIISNFVVVKNEGRRKEIEQDIETVMISEDFSPLIVNIVI